MKSVTESASLKNYAEKKLINITSESLKVITLNIITLFYQVTVKLSIKLILDAHSQIPSYFFSSLYNIYVFYINLILAMSSFLSLFALP